MQVQETPRWLLAVGSPTTTPTIPMARFTSSGIWIEAGVVFEELKMIKKTCKTNAS